MSDTPPGSRRQDWPLTPSKSELDRITSQTHAGKASLCRDLANEYSRLATLLKELREEPELESLRRELGDYEDQAGIYLCRIDDLGLALGPALDVSIRQEWGLLSEIATALNGHALSDRKMYRYVWRNAVTAWAGNESSDWWGRLPRNTGKVLFPEKPPRSWEGASELALARRQAKISDTACRLLAEDLEHWAEVHETFAAKETQAAKPDADAASKTGDGDKLAQQTEQARKRRRVLKADAHERVKKYIGEMLHNGELIDSPKLKRDAIAEAQGISAGHVSSAPAFKVLRQQQRGQTHHDDPLEDAMRSNDWNRVKQIQEREAKQRKSR